MTERIFIIIAAQAFALLAGIFIYSDRWPLGIVFIVLSVVMGHAALERMKGGGQ